MSPKIRPVSLEDSDSSLANTLVGREGEVTAESAAWQSVRIYAPHRAQD